MQETLLRKLYHIIILFSFLNENIYPHASRVKSKIVDVYLSNEHFLDYMIGNIQSCFASSE